MSNEPTIAQKNLVIGVFDGWIVNDNGTVSNPNSADKYEGRLLELTKAVFQYHSSWDWLMPVWFKIQSIGADMGYVFKKFHEAFHAGIDLQSVERCHHAAYQFIQWYNQSKQSNDTTKGND
jgi:hypothetical protein